MRTILRLSAFVLSLALAQPLLAQSPLAMNAIDDGAYVIMGPVFSGSIFISMTETRRAEIPNADQYLSSFAP